MPAAPDERRHITAREAEMCLGIRAGTVRQWARREKLFPCSTDKHKEQWYLLKDVLDLANRPRYRNTARGVCAGRT